MNKNSGQIIRIIAGVYLIYLGVKILMDVTRKQPSDMVFMAVMAVIFIVIGAIYAGIALKKILGISFKQKKEQMKNTQEVEQQFSPSSGDEEGNQKPVMLEAGPEKKVAGGGTADMTEDKEKEKSEETAGEEATEESSAVKEEKNTVSEEEKDSLKEAKEAEEVVQLEEIAEDEEPVSEEAENDFEEK